MSNPLDALGGIEVPSLKDFWTWVRNTFQPSYQSEIENYLASSTSHWEVEERIKRLQRRGMI